MLGKPIKPIEVIQYLKNEVASLANQNDGLHEVLKVAKDEAEYTKYIFDNMMVKVGELISLFTKQPCSAFEASGHTIQGIYDKAKKHFEIEFYRNPSENMKGVVYQTSQGWATAAPVAVNQNVTATPAPTVLTGKVTANQPVTTPANTPQGNVKSQGAPSTASPFVYVNTKEPEWIKDDIFPTLEYRNWGNSCLETRWNYKKD